MENHKLINANKGISVSVIIPSYNAEKTITICLRSIYSSDYKNFEIIVVDDNSSDQTVHLISEFPCKIIQMNKNAGPAKARNIGVEASFGDILVFFDADVIIEKDTIQRMVETFQEKPDISALFCSFKKSTIPKNFFTEYKNLRHHYTHQISQDYATTFCSGFGAIKREVFIKMNGFNENHRVLEDIELGYRLYKEGYKIYLKKDIQLIHCKEYSFLSLIKSDFFDRAIPWTKLMLTNKIFKNDLNTKSRNIISVFVSFVILLNLMVFLIIPESLIIFMLLITWFLFLNRRYFVFVLKEKSFIFTLKSIIMNWFSYLYSGVGLVVALIGFLNDSYIKPRLKVKHLPP